ncbi:hypothetical protein COT66_00860 [Candidatus Shapirobacteria bacterium CG09_land_8_20_14_0_10_49_15]|uniref:RNHCP domain-containing protein n=2 Tax=Candidatus Shapironibacteriota TaxID=1752721 RepID=A0A2M8L7M5_9BACT|nr:MAG: hypothetical protein COT66_00860 [Candidatus Shapirobacteria bacterium CG09_land_8_20_14_0_10_49_15]PJE70246.1 MAG: hypothetical protein COU97_00795 [Candidatus Shapirobacteria bacterium CG10_big_fil_rev_8_21_14_0_10_48_15]
MKAKRKHFIRKQENFVCDVCGTQVTGTGYTNHCPNCLWSKHLDEQVPGDRAAACHGLMEPIGVELQKNQYYIVHRCQSCHKITRTRTNSQDSFEKLLKINKQSY